MSALPDTAPSTSGEPASGDIYIRGLLGSRRNGIAAVVLTALIGLSIFAIRSSGVPLGATSGLSVLLGGLILWVVPMALIGDRAIRRNRMAPVGAVTVSVVSSIVLVTRPAGSYAQVWVVFIAAFSLIGFRLVAIVQRAVDRRRAGVPVNERPSGH
jgi:hypothetical protein